jgi:hypothetical protein
MSEFSTFIVSTTIHFPYFWKPKPPMFGDQRPPYHCVSFPREDLPNEVEAVLPAKGDMAMARSNSGVPMVTEYDAHARLLRHLWECMDYDNIARDRVLAGAPVKLAVDLFDIDNQFYRGKGLALRAVQVELNWLEKRYEQIVEEIRQAFRDRLDDEEEEI